MVRVLKFVTILLAAALALAPLPRHLVERVYARGIYPILQPRITAISNMTWLAFFDVVVLVTLAVVLAMWAGRLLRRHGGAVRTVGFLLVDTATVCAILYVWFLITWGLNYQRDPLRVQLDFSEARVTAEALRALAVRNVESLNAMHAAAHAAGWPELSDTPGVLGPAFEHAQRDLAMEWTAEPGRPKRTLLNFYFTRVSIDGMTDPFFLETLANQTLLPYERPATVAHEWSHLAGFADESEANFVGWLVCMRGPVQVQYSGWLALYGTVMSAVPRADREEILRQLEPGPRADLRAISERVRRQTVPIANRAGYALYDRFLKANRVESGIRSYGEVVRLLLGTRFTEDGVPLRR
jgi:hypothetical protein